MPAVRYSAPSRPSSPWVGLDPGERTGLAVWDADEGRFVRLGSKPFWGACGALEALAALDPCPVAAVVIEDARGLPLYARHRHLPREARDRAVRSVGRVDVQTDLLVQRCGALYLPLVLQEPGRLGPCAEMAQKHAVRLRRLSHAGKLPIRQSPCSVTWRASDTHHPAPIVPPHEPLPLRPRPPPRTPRHPGLHRPSPRRMGE